MKRKVATAFLLLYVLASIGAPRASAGNPYFYVTGPSRIFADSDNYYDIYLETDSETITATQIILNFDEAVIANDYFSNLGSRCSFWAPAASSLGFGNKATPYIQPGKVVIACGFSNPGLTSANPAKILTVHFVPNNDITSGISTTLTFSDPLFRYIGNTITSGTHIPLTLTSYDASQAAAPVPTPTPGIPPPDTLGVGDLTFVEIGSGSSGLSGFAGTSSNLAISENTNILSRDDSIPPPPANLVPREAVTPRPTPDPTKQSAGDVLSLQSLKELLVPGKSDADRTVVLINLLSTLAFLIILIILIWRLIMSRRLTKVKSEHIKDMLQGEISALEAKVEGGVMLESQELNAKLEELKKDLESL